MNKECKISEYVTIKLNSHNLCRATVDIAQDAGFGKQEVMLKIADIEKILELYKEELVLEQGEDIVDHNW